MKKSIVRAFVLLCLCTSLAAGSLLHTGCGGSSSDSSTGSTGTPSGSESSGSTGSDTPAEAGGAFTSDGLITTAAVTAVSTCAGSCASADATCFANCLNSSGITDPEDTQCLSEGLVCMDSQCATECAANDVNNPTCSSCFETKCQDAAPSCASSGAAGSGGSAPDDSASGGSDGSTPDSGGGSAGACDVDNDALFSSCSSSTSASAFGSCIQTGASLPSGCAQCYSDAMTCVQTTCASSCSDINSDACDSCRIANCDAAFDSCTSAVAP